MPALNGVRRRLGHTYASRETAPREVRDGGGARRNRRRPEQFECREGAEVVRATAAIERIGFESVLGSAVKHRRAVRNRTRRAR